ncbi:PadR family transcriptional regulator [Nocardioides jishulii]|uniref:PadR family transcriptional regulator n=1 Tax=Nocardioides jishulii TaxID=2575440 RepID=A0A4V5TKZ2_9ACTN|nr:PadR family transcriptional regulator [Nocardioides jishulii]QCX28880.1 PadR family transcriptional regulator [Nocardioides jishulii]TKI64223.1 PadR family transcriptional regulator [Nocardioides jishulii]
MSTSDALLALLEPAPAHGYTLKQDYDRWFAHKRPLAFGQVYATLTRLEKKGFVALADVEAGHGPDRRLYEITPDGVTALDAWVSTPQEPDLFATSTLYARLTVALLSGRDATQVLAGQREAHLTRMRELQKVRRDASGADLLAVTYELAHLDADLRWIEESGARLDQTRQALAAASGRADR